MSDENTVAHDDSPRKTPDTDAQQRFRAADAVFDAALELPPAERAAYVEQACASDTALRDMVTGLLRAHDASPDFLSEAAHVFGAPVLAATMPMASTAEPLQIGPFRVVRALGEGGMGTVYLAERVDAGFAQQVAIKTVRTTARSPELVTRFLAERRILAGLEHPNVARLIDGGVTSHGMPWFAMEYVAGEPVDAWCNARSLSVTQRIALFDTICDAVQYAHQALVVHRDLKPSNIFVTTDGQVKLLDFGIAKVLVTDTEDGDDPTLTIAHALTPQYAAPEQLTGAAVGAATDVYALGLLLFELLSGQRPYSLKGLSATEAARVVCDVDAPRMTSVSMEGAGTRGTTPEKLRRTLAGDLDSIVAKALRKSPADRYATVAALREDLARWKDGLPVRARPADLPYRVRRFVARHRVPVFAGAAAVVLAAVAFARERALRTEAQAAARKAEAVTAYMTGVFDFSDPATRFVAKTDTLTARQALDRSLQQIEANRALDPETESQFRLALGKVYADLGALDVAAQQARRTLAIAKARGRGDDDADVAAAKDLLGNALTGQKKFDEAEPMLRAALAARRKTLGDTAALTAASMQNLSAVLRETNRLKEANDLLLEAHAVHSRAPASRQRDAALAWVAHDLGLTASIMGNEREAERRYREALNLEEPIAGHNTLRVARIRFGQAQSAHMQFKSDSAVAMYRDVLTLYERFFGTDHEEYASASFILGNLLLFQYGKVEEATRMFEKSLRINRQQLGPTAWVTVSNVANLAEVLMMQRDVDGAERILQETYAALKNSPGHPREMTTILMDLGGVAMERKDYATAIKRFEEAIPLLRSTGRSDDEEFVKAASLAIARAQLERGDVAGAEARYRAAMVGVDTATLPGLLRRVQATTGLARLLVRVGRAQEAKSLLAPWLAVSDRNLSPRNSLSIEARIVLASALAAMNDSAGAAASLRQLDSVAPLLRVAGPMLVREHAQVLRTLRGR